MTLSNQLIGSLRLLQSFLFCNRNKGIHLVFKRLNTPQNSLC